MESEKNAELNTMDPVWAGILRLGLYFLAILYGITVVVLALFGHIKGISTLILVTDWFLFFVLFFWFFIDSFAGKQEDGDLTQNGLYPHKLLIGLAVLICVLLVAAGLTFGRSFLSTWVNDLGLRPFSTLSILAGLLLTGIAYVHGVFPYRVQWRAWNRQGRVKTRYQEEAEAYDREHFSSSGGDPRGFTRRPVGPFKLTTWLFEFLFDWLLFLLGIVLIASGIVSKFI